MGRFFAGVAACFLMMIGALMLWQSRAPAAPKLPEAPVFEVATAVATVPPLAPPEPRRPPTASAKSREEKRFARADKDDDGRITRDELFDPRRKRRPQGA